jgi:hypothetical protein
MGRGCGRSALRGTGPLAVVAGLKEISDGHLSRHSQSLERMGNQPVQHYDLRHAAAQARR